MRIIISLLELLYSQIQVARRKFLKKKPRNKLCQFLFCVFFHFLANSLSIKLQQVPNTKIQHWANSEQIFKKIIYIYGIQILYQIKINFLWQSASLAVKALKVGEKGRNTWQHVRSPTPICPVPLAQSRKSITSLCG